MIELRYRGWYADLAGADRRALCDRSASTDALVVNTVRAIVDDVRRRGDDPLSELARRFDPAVPATLDLFSVFVVSVVVRRTP